MSSQLCKSAFWYAKRGWTIFPLRPGTKEPFANLGVYGATADLSQIGQWWQRWPQANIGLHPGGCGLLGLDLDTYKETFGGDTFGRDSSSRIALRTGALSTSGLLNRADEETITNLTGGGGTHLLYATAAGERISNQRGNLPPGIDIKGWGGYLVLPPSIHPSGKAYQWESGYGPHEIAAMPLPDSLRRLLAECGARPRVVGPPDVYAVQIGVKLVESLLYRLQLSTYGMQTFDGSGRKWVLCHCPFCPPDNRHADDRAAFILVGIDGHISAGCHHERCRQHLHELRLSGWRYLVGEFNHVYA